MTREEAIEILLQRKNCMEYVTDNDDEAFDMAIKALEHPERNVVAIVPCGDTISRQAVIDLMMQKWGENFSGDDAMQESIDAIRVMPSVTPQPRKGHWIIDTHKIRTFGSKNATHDYSVHCDKCNYAWDYTTDNEESLVSNFCPNCGARMVEPQESEG